MTSALRAVQPGLHVTLQDAGRVGLRHLGVSGSGAMDRPALALANALVGNPPGAAALEFAHAGGSWAIGANSCRIAVTGGDFAVAADGQPLATWQSHTLRAGQTLSVKGAPDAVWGYIAVAGGFAVAPELGSVSTHQRSGLGGLQGRSIVAGDLLPLRLKWAPDGRELRAPPLRRAPGPLRVVMGPQAEDFTPEAVSTFLSITWRVTHRGDRMGMWLDGPRLTHTAGYDIVSDGLVPGCIQVPGSGQPVVLLMDCQTVGGYPKIATIITADLPRLAQSRPGTGVTFAAVDVAAAQHLYRAYHAVFADIGRTVQAVPDLRPGSSWLTV